MISINFVAVAVSALIPLIIGFVWYNPKVFGNKWMVAAGLSEEEASSGNMPVIFGLSLLFSFMLALLFQSHVIHQIGAFGMIGGDETTALPSYKAFMTDYLHAHRSFGHGAFHGFLTGFLFVFPIMATNALFERKSWSYILINAGYWTVCLILMGGLLCAWT